MSFPSSPWTTLDVPFAGVDALPPWPVRPQDAHIIVCGLVGILLSFYFAGVALCQYILIAQSLFPHDQTPQQKERNARLRQTKKWRLTVVTVAVLALASGTDFVLKVFVALLYVRSSLLHGIPGIMRLPRVALGVSVIEGCVALIVQAVYIVRLYFIWPGPSRSLLFYLSGTTFLSLALAQLGASIWAGILVKSMTLQEWGDLRPAVAVWWGAASVNDVLLCGAFSYALWSIRTGFDKTDSVIKEWILFTFETGLVSTILQLTTLLLYLFGWDKAWWLASVLPMSDVYVNSILLLFRTMLGNTSGTPSTTASIITGPIDSRSGATKHQHFSAVPLSSPVTPKSPPGLRSGGHRDRWATTSNPASAVMISTSYARDESYLDVPDRKSPPHVRGEKDRNYLDDRPHGGHEESYGIAS